jgi:guanylate kinase
MGPLIIVSGPSGVGKSTIIERLLADAPVPLRLSVSATTRSARPEERDGEDYHFWTRERFATEIAAGAFLEHAIVHGEHYGTLRSEVEPFRRAGTGVVLDIDVQGAQQVRRIFPDNISVFVRAATMEQYEQRLRQRGTEEESELRKRLSAAAAELALADTYSYQIVNDDPASATAELRRIVADRFARARDDG